jgi:hypothetical protein
LQSQTPAPNRNDPSKVAAPVLVYPSHLTLQEAMVISMKDCKPIQVSFWQDSLEEDTVMLLRNKETKEQIIFKNEDEYTSPIVQITPVKGTNDLICETENSIYLLFKKNIRIVEQNN